MSFIALVLTLALAMGWPYGPVLHQDDWFEKWQSLIQSLGLRGVPAILAIVILPALALQLVLNAVQPMLFGLLWIALAVVSLLYAIGRGDISTQLENYRNQLRRDDFEGIYLHARTEMNGFEGSTEQRMSPHAVHENMQHGLLYRGYEHWFAVLFYFLLLGPAGAVCYRLLQLIPEGEGGADRLLFVVDWIPARLLAAAFTVTGNFVESWDELLDSLLAPDMAAPAVLYSVAMAATGEDRRALPDVGFGAFAARQNEALSALMRRSAIFWLVLVSLLIVLL